MVHADYGWLSIVDHETPGRQTKQTNQLSFPHQDDCEPRMDTKKRIPKHRTITESHNESKHQQRINNTRTTALERTSSFVNYATV